MYVPKVVVVALPLPTPGQLYAAKSIGLLGLKGFSLHGCKVQHAGFRDRMLIEHSSWRPLLSL